MNGTSICITTMDRGNELKQTLDCIQMFAVAPYEIIIVDNNSTEPEALNVLKSAESFAMVIRNDSNLGLSIATNQGFEQGRYEYLIHMDNDCLVRVHGWNQKIVEYFNDPEIGMIVPSQSPISIRHRHHQELLWALGMCWAIRKDLFEDIGGYDPQLLHQNECDMALRVRMAGYHLAGIPDFQATHNDPGGPRSDMSLAREHLGCVQFRDKWTSYFRGRDWNYGTDPIYLMQHWPPDQDFLRRFGEQEGIDLNPSPDEMPSSNEADAGWHRNGWVRFDQLDGKQKINIKGTDYLIFRELRNDYCHWEHRHNPGAYLRDRNQAIARWFELTGELYEGYKWPHNLLRPY